MKLLLTLFIAFHITISFSQSDSISEKYENSQLITIENAHKIDSLKNTPASIVTYFYASKIRKDNKWKKVIPLEENRSERLKRKLITYSKWTITQFKLVSKTSYEKDKLWIKVFFEIEYKGQKDSGTDDVTVELINGKWVITSVPT